MRWTTRDLPLGAACIVTGAPVIAGLAKLGPANAKAMPAANSEPRNVPVLSVGLIRPASYPSGFRRQNSVAGRMGVGAKPSSQACPRAQVLVARHLGPFG